jgi:hypothetical protein
LSSVLLIYPCYTALLFFFLLVLLPSVCFRRNVSVIDL